MARKKSEVAEEVIEEVKTVEEVAVEEKPKRTRKKKVEEPVEEVKEPVEEVKEPEPVAEPVAEPEPEVEVVGNFAAEVKAVPEVKAEEKAFEPYKAVAKSALNVTKGAGMTFNKIGSISAGSKITVLEVSGNFGRVGKDRWININFIEKI